MRQLFISTFLALIFTLAACSDQILVSETTDCPKYVELNYSNYNSLSTDPISIISAKVDGDCLKLTLQYGGGCKEHQVDLAFIQPECGTPPLPPPTFEIRHNANSDACKALVTKEYNFDLKGIREEGKNKTDFILGIGSSTGITNTNTYTYTY
jgi:hypothetical protein